MSRISRDLLGLPLSYLVPESEAEIRLCDTWQELLNIDKVGLDDDFFELGGDSIAATALAAAIESYWKVKFSPSDIITYATPAEQLDFIESQAGSAAGEKSLPGFVTGVNTEGKKPPLFMIHGVVPFIMLQNELFRALGDDQPVYLFQAPGLDGREEPLYTMEDYCETYSNIIKRIEPGGKWRISANCASGLIALEICRIMELNGGSVERLLLIDPPKVPKHLEKQYPVIGRRAFKKNLARVAYRLVNAIRGHGFVIETEEDAFVREMRNRATRQKTLEAKFQVKKNNTGKSPIPLEVETAYTPETTLRVGMALFEALNSCVPKPWPGKAHMLVTAPRQGRQRKRKDPFWSKYIGEIEHEVIECTHAELFEYRSNELAEFINKALQ